MFLGMDKGEFRTSGKPVAVIKINGQKVIDWISFKVDLNGLGDIDSFSVKLPWDVSDTPRDELLYSGSARSSALVAGSAVISVEAGFEGEDLKLLIEGSMDYPVWDFDGEEGETVEIKGRSFAAAPYDFKETVKYQNTTATDAHAKMAAAHGLNPIAPVKSTAMIGEYIEHDHATVTQETSHWDYVLYMAENEGFVSRVRGRDWYFGPIEQLPNYSLEPLPFSWGVNILSGLSFERAPNAARSLIVEIISWQPGKKGGKGTRIVEKASFKDSSSGHKYIIREYKPGITRDEAQRYAQNKLALLSSQQMNGSFSCDYSTNIDNDRRIVLYGVGKGISAVYYITRVQINGSRNGFECSLEFSNLPLGEI